MAAANDTTVDLVVADYSDWHSAEADWDDLKLLVKDYRIVVDGMVLVRSLPDGTIHIDDDFHMTGKGAVGGLVVGLIFPPCSSPRRPARPSAGSCPIRRSRASSRRPGTYCRLRALQSWCSARRSGLAPSRRRSLRPTG